MSFEIVPAEESDFEGINKVNSIHNEIPNNHFNPTSPSSPNDILETDDRIFFVLRKDQKVIAYLSLHRASDNYAEFEILVDPNHRNNGFGQKLMEKAIEYTSEKDGWVGLRAKIKKGNDVSLNLCQKFGFKNVYDGSLGTDWHLDLDR